MFALTECGRGLILHPTFGNLQDRKERFNIVVSRKMETFNYMDGKFF